MPVQTTIPSKTINLQIKEKEKYFMVLVNLTHVKIKISEILMSECLASIVRAVLVLSSNS